MMAGTQLHPYLEKHLEFLATQAYTCGPLSPVTQWTIVIASDRQLIKLSITTHTMKKS